MAKELGISRDALPDWERKAVKAAKGEGPPRTSGLDPKTVEKRRDAAILAKWSNQQGLGPSQIRNQQRRAGIKVSVRAVRRVIEGVGSGRRRSNGGHTRDGEAVGSGQQWPPDVLYRFVHGHKVFVLAIIDDYFPFVTGPALDAAERAEVVIGAFEGAVGRHSKPGAVMSDGGSGCWAWTGSSRFSLIIEEDGVDQLVATTLDLAEKCEVFIANLQMGLFNRVTFTDLGDLRSRLGPPFRWYNHCRTHHAMGGLVALTGRAYGRVGQGLVRFEPGGGVLGALGPTLRTLDLFLLVSPPTVHSVPSDEVDVPPVLVAALLLAAHTHLDPLDPPHPTAAKMADSTGGGRTQASVQSRRNLAILPTLLRPPGRPIAPTPAAATAAINRDVIALHGAHPGARSNLGTRRTNMDDFWHFVLELTAGTPLPTGPVWPLR